MDRRYSDGYTEKRQKKSHADGYKPPRSQKYEFLLEKSLREALRARKCDYYAYFSIFSAYSTKNSPKTMKTGSNKAFHRTAHKVRCPVNADVRAQKMKYLAPTIVLLAVHLSSGCAVLSMLGYPKPEYREIRKGYFPATKTDVVAIKGLYTNDTTIPLRIVGTPLFIIDMPFSLCYDIIDAPFKSIEKAHSRKSKRLEQWGPGYPPQGVGSPDP